MNADDFAALTEHAKSTKFEPFACYNRDGDFIEFLVSDEDYVADRLDGFVTVYRLRDQEGRIVGAMIKDISKLTREARILVRHGKVRLDVVIIVRAALAANERTIHVYEQLRDLAAENEQNAEIDIETLNG